MPSGRRARPSPGLGRLGAALLLACASCAGGLDDIDRFAPPALDAGELVIDAGQPGDDGGRMDAGEADDAGEMDAGAQDGGEADAGEPDDAGAPDAGEPDDAGGLDAGEPDDAGELDAGEPGDAGEMDAGGADAGPPDAGAPDAGAPDAGIDGGVHDGGTDGGVDAGTPDAGPCDALTTIIAPTCATTFCHSNGGSGMQGGLDLQSPGLPGRLIGQLSTESSFQIINRQSPDQSALYLKVLKPPPYQSQMPLAGKALTTAQVACLRSWIHAAVGAP